MMILSETDGRLVGITITAPDRAGIRADVRKRLAAAGVSIVTLKPGQTVKQCPDSAFRVMSAVRNPMTVVDDSVRAIAIKWFWRPALSPQRLAARCGACLVALPGLTWRAVGAQRL